MEINRVDVEILDQWETYKAAFLTQFPSLKKFSITSTVLPPFNRARAQKYWEEKFSL